MQEIAADLEVADISGKKLDALTVFTRTIEFFRHHLTKTIANAVPEIQEKEIGWVITVPAIWCDSAKKLVRLAAEKVRELSRTSCYLLFSNVHLVVGVKCLQ